MLRRNVKAGCLIQTNQADKTSQNRRPPFNLKVKWLIGICNWRPENLAW